MSQHQCPSCGQKFSDAVLSERMDAGVAPGQSPALPHSKTQAKRFAAQAGETPRTRELTAKRAHLQAQAAICAEWEQRAQKYEDRYFSERKRAEQAEAENVELKRDAERLDGCISEFRDTVLSGRHRMAENGMTSEQVNDVLSELDAAIDRARSEEKKDG